MPQAELKFQLIKGDRVDADSTPRVDYRDALSVNITGIIRPIFDIQGYMLEQPGIAAFGTGEGNDRGAVWNERQGTHFRVSGDKFISVDNNGVSTVLGTVLGTPQVSLPYSFNTQAIIAGGNYYLYDPTNGFRPVIDVDLGVPIDAVWVDSYYFFTDGDFLYHTDIDDESSIDPLQFATAEFSPDSTVGVGKTTDNKVIAFGRYTIEYFENRANPQFAFTRLPSRAIKYGLVATHLKAEIGGQWYFVGGPKEGSLSIYKLGIGNAEEIASREVTVRLAEYNETELANAVMEARVMDGYPALIVHLPNETLFFNIKVAAFSGNDQAWSLLESTGGTQWRAINGIFVADLPQAGKWIYGDKTTSQLGEIDVTLATQYGAKVPCFLYTPFYQIETASLDELQIESIPGFNTTNDATVFIALSYDGALYGAEVPLQYGIPGDIGARFIARRLGYVRNYFTMRLRWVSASRMAFSRGRFLYG